MKPINFEKFWEIEFDFFAKKYANEPELLVTMRNLAKRAWEQSRYTSDNEGRD